MPTRLSVLTPTVFVLLWSTGFVGAKFGLPYAEPFTFLAIRFSIVAIILFVIVLIFRAPWPSRPMMYFHLAVSGILLHGIYLGGVFAAIHHGVSAGVSAVIVGAQPVLTAILIGPLIKERVGVLQWLGILLGFAGVALVVWEKLDLNGADTTGFALCVMGLFGITLGTIYQKHHCTNMDLRSGSLVQFTATLVFIWCCAWWLESGIIQWSPPFFFALAWLSIVLSVGAITLLMLMIRHGAAAKVASLFYLVPPVTALMAFFLFDETLASTALSGMAMTAIGVILVNKT